MIDIKDKKDCCGCNACGDVCAHKAITFVPDIEGFWYPKVNKDLCTDCSLCEKVCPVISFKELKKNEFEQSECHAAIHKNIETRFDSTSGGLFSALAEKIYKAGGYVGGAIFTEKWGVRHFISSDKKDLAALRSSKYLQSNATDFYKAVKELVVKGEQVLVCGTPCQMSALRKFLKKDYDNIIIVDFICRGINSPKVFRKYLDYLEERFGAEVVYFKAKNKEWGWRELTSKVVFKNGKVLYDTKETSYFTIGYLQTNVYCRPSCYECKFKGFPRISDITIADFWGAERVVGKELDNDMGTSLVMLNNSKGKKYYDSIKTTLIEKEVPFDSVIKQNPALVTPLDPPHVDRQKFYQDLDVKPFKIVAEKYIKRNIDQPLSKKAQIKNVIRFLLEIKRISGFNICTVVKNLYYNLFSQNVHANIPKGFWMIVSNNTIIDLHPTSMIELNGKLTLGWKKFTKSKLETRLLVEDGATLKIGRKGWSVGYGSDVEIFKDATLDVKGGGATNINATIICGERIELGERVMLGRDVTIRDNNGSHYIARRGYKNTHPVVIGQHAWLCEGCCVIGGAKIGDGAIIGAKSLVATHIPAFSMVAGVPAQVIDEDVYWKY